MEIELRRLKRAQAGWLLLVGGGIAALSLSPGTVSRAYRELEYAGVVVGRGRRGTFVTDEPTQGSVHFGLACDALTETVAGSGFSTQPAVKVDWVGAILPYNCHSVP